MEATIKEGSLVTVYLRNGVQHTEIVESIEMMSNLTVIRFKDQLSYVEGLHISNLPIQETKKRT